MANKPQSKKVFLKDLTTANLQYPSILDQFKYNEPSLIKEKILSKKPVINDKLQKVLEDANVSVDLTPRPPKTIRDRFGRTDQPLRPPARRKDAPSGTAPGGVVEADQFLTLDEVIENIKTDTNPNKLVAISVTGGGARGPYEAGVIESIIKKFSLAGIAMPQLVAGTSAGSICATCTFVDLLYPRTSPPTNASDDIFFTRQARVWRDTVAKGNNGSEVLFKDMAWLVHYMTKKKPIPGVELFFDTIQNIETAWGNLQSDITGLATTGKDLLNAFISMDGTALAAKIKIVTDTISADKSDIQSEFNKLVNALRDFDLNPFDGDTPVGDAQEIIAAAWDLLKALGEFLADLANGAFQIGVGAVQSLLDYFENIGRKFAAFGQALGRLISDGGALIGNAVLLGGLIAAFMGMIVLILAKAGSIILGLLLYFLGDAALVATGMIEDKPFDHILPNEGVMKVLQDFIDTTSVQFAIETTGNAKNRMTPLNKWIAQAANNQNRPEIYLTGTDLNASRNMVFALADKVKVASMTADDVWVYDMAAQLDVQTPLMSTSINRNDGFILDSDGIEKATTSKYFAPISPGKDELVKATMTSSSIPCAFEPQKWAGHRRSPADLNKTESIAWHSFVDGGLINNSPVDLTIYGQATHIISIELSPLYSYNSHFDPKKKFNLGTLAMGSFNAAMTGSMQRSLSYIGRANEELPDDKKRNIYRVAPLVPAEVAVGNGDPVAVSPGTFHFDGLYNDKHHLAMSLYDWFMQGYIDGMGYEASQSLSEISQHDPVIADYLQKEVSHGLKLNVRPLRNQFWYMTDRPIPENVDYQIAKIELPDPQDLISEVTRA